MKDISHDKFKIQSYLKNDKFSFQEKQLLFKLRTRMIDVKDNFKTMYNNLDCNLCNEDTVQSDAHLLECSYLINTSTQLNNNHTSEYEDIFGDNKEQLRITKLYMNLFKIKSNFEEKDDN